MSCFYLTPVKGNMPMHLLETIINKRIEFLIAVMKGQSAEFNEYVIEGSLYDNVGFYMLCITLILCENKDISQFFIKAEMELFKRRLLAHSPYDTRSFAKKLLRSIKKYESAPDFIKSLEILSQHLMIKTVAQHLKSHDLLNTRCSVFNVKINFQHCLPFIAKRQVELNRGIAVIPCSKWIHLLIHLFYKNLIKKVTQVNPETLRNDSRIVEMVMKIKKQNLLFLSLNTKEKQTNILSRDIDAISSSFPPCMSNLHNNLRKKHRLSHEQRFLYSLFLKDIGLPIEEAIEFWKSEYRQTPIGNNSCCHHWEKDEKKYLYGIRHMYGLEGSRKNYSSVSCQRIQNNTGLEGGCPFKSFDCTGLVELLDDEYTGSQKILSQIIQLKNKGNYSSACLLSLNHKIGKCTTNHCDHRSFNFTPVKYYKIMKDNKLLLSL